MSVSRHHADWLSLVESSGPFLSLPVLLRAFPQGLDPRDPEQAKQLRLAYEEWQENPNLAGKQRVWVMHVLTQVLLHPKELLAEGQTLPPGLMATMAEYGEILRPELALVGPMGSEMAGKPQLLVSLYPEEQSLDKPVIGKHWKATPGTRMMELLHATDVPLGLVTNGEEWMLVFAPRGDTTGFTSWYASLWIDEPITLRAFHSLLSVRRFFGVAPSDTLLALLKESAQDQQEVTNQLGDQVRDAVEVLIQAFDRLDQDSGRTLLKGLDEKSLYDAALTVMMRLVFLFSAEERGLLHLGEPLYDDNYAVSTLREQLQEVADHYGEEVLERRHDGWARLLASFRAVHGGVNHQDLMLPAYGGSLFDPDRYPFLEGRAQSTRWQSSPAAPLEINNRVVLHLLKSLQMLQVKVPGGGPAEALRVSFEGLNIEQIGHVYEGLLDHTAVRAKEVVLGLAASRKKPVASIALAESEKLRQDDEAKFVELLEEETGRSGKALEKALKNGGEPEDFHKLLIACGQDKELAERIIPFRGLLRQDSFERLVVALPGGIYVGQGSARRSTGTHYTPRSLTEPIVQHTLEPLLYQGPAEGLPKEQWRLRSPKEILDLKVCDMAMGSGAFLVQACRYLSERLVEAWENLEKEHPGEVLITPEGGFSQGEPNERLVPKEAAERLAVARRLVADRCIYGVDINPMAVEMAKLSIWLITVDKSRPFTFLDHALKCGDSLLGIYRFKQLETFSLDDDQTKQVIILSNYDDLIRVAIANRRQLEMLPSNDSVQIATKAELLADTDDRLSRLKLAADLLLSTAFSSGNQNEEAAARVRAHLEVIQYIGKSVADFRKVARERLRDQDVFHWPLEFPEVIERGGFDGFVGNPPFVGGKRISSLLGEEYANALTVVVPESNPNADISAKFHLRAFALLRPGRAYGLLATDRIAEGDTRIGGLEQIIRKGGQIFRAETSKPWPGNASVRYSPVHVFKGDFRGKRFLNDTEVTDIDSSLCKSEGFSGTPEALLNSWGTSYVGCAIQGAGFIVEKEEAAVLLEESRNSEIVRPFLIANDLNHAPDMTPSRWVINFDNRDLKEASRFRRCLEIVEERVKPHRDAVNRKAHRERWWQFGDRRPGLVGACVDHEKVIACAMTTVDFKFAWVPSSWVFDQTVVVIVPDCTECYGVLESLIHKTWAYELGSGFGSGGAPRYNPSRCFETFPFPRTATKEERALLAKVGDSYHKHREGMMLARGEGLTTVYSRFHDPSETSPDVATMRVMQIELDRVVAAAYKWTDLNLFHGFHETKHGIRFTIGEAARRIALTRLLTLNQQYHQEEIRPPLYGKDARRGIGKRSSGKARAEENAPQGDLY